MAGLLARPVIPPGSTRPRNMACLGNDSKIEKKGGETAIAPANPVLLPPITLKLTNFQVSG